MLYITAFVLKDLKSIDLTQVLMSFGAEDIFKNVSSLIYYNLSLRHRFGSLWWEVRKKQKTEYLKNRTWLFYKKNSQPAPQIVKLRNTFWRVFIRDHSFSTYAKFSKKIKKNKKQNLNATEGKAEKELFSFNTHRPARLSVLLCKATWTVIIRIYCFVNCWILYSKILVMARYKIVVEDKWW